MQAGVSDLMLRLYSSFHVPVSRKLNDGIEHAVGVPKQLQQATFPA